MSSHNKVSPQTGTLQRADKAEHPPERSRVASRAFASGKVILFGEHSVVYGHPAIAAGIAAGASATAAPSDQGNSLSVEPWGVTVDDTTPPGESKAALQKAFCAVLSGYADSAGGAGRSIGTVSDGGASEAQSHANVALHVEVGLPAGAGLGCSAAMGVAIIKALDAFYGVERDAAAQAEASLAWERVFHGKPSGVDSAMAALGGCMSFTRGEAPQPLSLKRELRLVVAHSGERGVTEELVRSVARQRERDEARIERTFDAIASIVRNAQTALEDGDLRAVGQLMDMNQMLLGALHVSTSKLEQLCAVARDSGALGAKLTGSGGGGCMIALVPDEQNETRVCDALAKISALVMPVTIAQSVASQESASTSAASREPALQGAAAVAASPAQENEVRVG